jgi:hypothetical protein
MGFVGVQSCVPKDFTRNFTSTRFESSKIPRFFLCSKVGPLRDGYP